MENRVVFLDKDGTLIHDVPYNVDPAQIRLMSGVVEGLQALQHAGYHLIVITNQSGVARGYFPESALAAVERQLRTLLAACGVSLAGFYYCPHHPDGDVARVRAYSRTCACRKPESGLLRRAARDHDLDLSRSWLVGDILNDVEAGRRVGCRTILIDNGGETEWILTPQRQPHYTVSDFNEVAPIITAALTNYPTTQPTNRLTDQLTNRRTWGKSQW